MSRCGGSRYIAKKGKARMTQVCMLEREKGVMRRFSNFSAKSISNRARPKHRCMKVIQSNMKMWNLTRDGTKERVRWR